MPVAITHVYDDPAAAEKVVKDLEEAGFSDDQISLVGRAKDEEAQAKKCQPEQLPGRPLAASPEQVQAFSRRLVF